VRRTCSSVEAISSCVCSRLPSPCSQRLVAARLSGQPTEIVEHRQTTAELWAEFAAMFPSVVNGTAEEITDAEVVPGAGSGAGFEPGPEFQADAEGAPQA
jgi:hypothetical protein